MEKQFQKSFQIFGIVIRVLNEKITLAWQFYLLLHTDWSWRWVQPDPNRSVNTIDTVYAVHMSAHLVSCATKSVHSTTESSVLFNTYWPIKFPVLYSWLRDSLLIRMTGSMSSTSQWACITLFMCWEICYHHIPSIDQLSKLAWKLWGSVVYCSSSWDKTTITWLR